MANILWGLDERRRAVAKEEKLKRDLVRKMKGEGSSPEEIADIISYPLEKVKRVVGNASAEDYAEEWNRVCEPFRKMAKDVGKA